ncbi:hypothetical protein R6242_08345 [Iodobacter sp. CM08]|uniref:hypothetical protein n=1 Tax=Iodobacter sp. CM08 TaxID=3085902 RepID=UPI002980AB25|nr:hypothetical protein [Iodobacter sp. CM08]MDW5416577.1 hypothetical protein [Iodobacter sp. CM08]
MTIKMPAKLSDIIDAIDFISGDSSQSSEAFIQIASGQVFIRSEYLDNIEDIKLPTNLSDKNLYLSLPSKHDLDLASKLPLTFTNQFAPDYFNEVHSMFKHRGAFGRFKDWADRHQLLSAWYLFEEKSTQAAIKDWCQENDIILAEEN